MKIKKLFQGTFEQSKRIAKRRETLLFSNDYRHINNNSIISRLFVDLLLGGFMIMVWGFISAGFMLPKGKIPELRVPVNVSYGLASFLRPVLIILLIFLGLMLVRWLLPIKNIVMSTTIGGIIMMLLLVIIMVAMAPMLVQWTLESGGIFYFVLSCILVIDFEIYRFSLWVKKSISTMYTQPLKLNTFERINHKIFTPKAQLIAKISNSKFHRFISSILIFFDRFNKTFFREETHLQDYAIATRFSHLVTQILIFLRVLIISLVIALIGIIVGLNNSVIKDLNLRIFVCFFFPWMYLLLFGCLRLCLSTRISWFYIKKFSKQYRLYYKIPDRVWYLSERRAAKHPSVYRPEDEKETSSSEI
ncbi:hypothetical protein [Lactobacillus sp. PV034]|uniref:hypothetical protein n=1 Tax=Lactobacillus sp. PV034 TaxID=2594495 RepID=UPI00223FC1DF|nr:hypothetical protein [Lactobacillus sp. PV034]QNQ80172.1 hypothetical protein FP432_00685 [Lactobacillus sp. PV034]